MRLPAFILLFALCAACSRPEPVLPYVDSTSADGEPLRRYAHARLDGRAGEKPLQVETGQLDFKGPVGLRRVLAHALKVRLQSPDGKALLKLDAGSLFFVAGGNELEFAGNVLLDVPDYGQLELDSARWDMREPVFRSAGALRLIVEEGIMDGEGIEANLLLSRFEVKKVTGFLKAE